MKTFTRPKGKSDAEIREFQEKKTQSDLISEAHQRISALNEGLVFLSLQYEKNRTQVANEKQTLLIAFETLKDSVDKLLNDVSQRLGNVETKLSNIVSAFNELKEDSDLKYLTKEEFEHSYSDLGNLVVSNHLKQTMKNDNYNQYLAHLKENVKEDLRMIREELAPKPSEIDPVKLDEKFQVWKVDFDGLVKEIALLKKAVSYDQKKFENIYTLIERLKGGKECPPV